MTEPCPDAPASTARAERRLVAALRGQRTDRPPFWYMRQAGRYLPEYREVRAQAGSFLDLCFTPEAACEVTLQPIRRYGMDAAILFSDILVVPWALGQSLAYVEGEGPKLGPVRDSEGLAALDGGPAVERLAPVYETVSRVRAALPEDVALIGFAGAPWTVATYMVEGGTSRDFLTVKRLALGEGGDPGGVFDRLAAMVVEATIGYLDRQVCAGADAVQIFDTWAGALPESAFRRWVIAPTKAIVDGLRARHPDIPIIGFPRGAGALYPDYIRETGVDAVGLDSGVPLAWARQSVQSLATVQGCLDPAFVVEGGPGMHAEVDRILAAFGDGPFVFNLGHGIPPATSPDVVAELSARLGGGPR
ncbi:MAG: uroporphyrinogen decarboxylase [Azospirillaceae bacterium]